MPTFVRFPTVNRRWTQSDNLCTTDSKKHKLNDENLGVTYRVRYQPRILLPVILMRGVLSWPQLWYGSLSERLNKNQSAEGQTPLSLDTHATELVHSIELNVENLLLCPCQIFGKLNREIPNVWNEFNNTRPFKTTLNSNRMSTPCSVCVAFGPGYSL